MRYNTAKDMLFGLIFMVPFAISSSIVILLFILFFLDIIPEGDLTGIYIFGPVSIFCSIVWFGFLYTIKNGLLTISIIGIKVYKLHLSNVIKIEKRYKSTYIYGLSSDIISLKLATGSFTFHYIYKEVNVSPKNKKGFIETILNENPKIEVDPKLIQKYNIEIKDSSTK